MFSVIGFKRLTYNGIYEYPDWAVGIGWLMALSSMVAIPAYMIYAIATTPGTLREVSLPILFYLPLAQRRLKLNPVTSSRYQRLHYLVQPQLVGRQDGITKVITDVKANSIMLKQLDAPEDEQP